MTRIYDEFQQLVTSRKNYRARGFININCPACGDRRQRGGFAPTQTGGFRYFCFNGGCEYHDQPTGWEPGNGLVGRVRHLFELLGGNIHNIPMRELLIQNRNLYDKNGNVIGQAEHLEVTRKFPDCDLPRDTDLLVTWAEQEEEARDVLDYLDQRGEFYKDAYPFLWSPARPKYLIIPYMHYNDQIVGYLGRHIEKTSGADRFIQRAPEDYLFNQHELTYMNHSHVFVMEAPLDAIALRGLATRGSKFTQKQINLLKISGKTPVLIPDRQGKEWKNYLDVAEEQEWPIAIPDWGDDIKDPGEAVQQNGLLYTVEQLMDERTQNYASARIRLNTGR